MKVDAMLNPPFHQIDNYKKDKVCGVVEERTA
jgi:hypothetical protein